jgi:hypothetical protein
MRKICLFSSIISIFIISQVLAGNDPFSFTKNSSSKFSPALASKKEVNEGGFYIHLGVMAPTKNYYYPKGVLNTTDKRFSIGGGLELGELFLLTKNRSNSSIGARLTLVNAEYTTYSFDGKVKDQIIEGSIFDLGPNITIGFNEHHAVDLYYQFCPTYMYNFKDTIEYTTSGSYGFIHSFGFGYRYSQLSFGATYSIGNVLYLDATSNSKYMKHCMDHFRFYIGVIF